MRIILEHFVEKVERKKWKTGRTDASILALVGFALGTACLRLVKNFLRLDRHNNFLTFLFMNDEKLYTLCKKYGESALYYRRKFIGLLPEVYKRKLYAKKKFGSIFEFAARLAGVSEEQVRRALNLEK